MAIVCDLCKTEFLSTSSVRVVQCTCDGTHHACLACRRAMSRSGMARYEGKGMVLHECPIAWEVAAKLMEGGEEC